MILRILAFISSLGMFIFFCGKGLPTQIILSFIIIGYQIYSFSLEAYCAQRRNYKKYFKVLTTDEWSALKERYADYKAEKHGKD